MSSLFLDKNSFNGDISNWDVSRVTDMNRMFMAAEKFDCDLSNWDVSTVTNMSHMFCWAHSFKGEISKSKISTVTQEAPAFDARIYGTRTMNAPKVSCILCTNYMSYLNMFTT